MFININIYLIYMIKEIKIRNFEEVIENKVTKFGTGAHITIPQKHLGKKATIVIEK